MRSLPAPSSVIWLPPSIVTLANFAGSRALPSVIVALPPQSNVIAPPFASALFSAASVQLAAVPVPTTVAPVVGAASNGCLHVDFGVGGGVESPGGPSVGGVVSCVVPSPGGASVTMESLPPSIGEDESVPSADPESDDPHAVANATIETTGIDRRGRITGTVC